MATPPTVPVESLINVELVNVLYTHPYIPSKFHGKQYKCILFSELVIYLFREKVESLVRRRKSRILCVDVIPLAFITYTWFQKHCC